MKFANALHDARAHIWTLRMMVLLMAGVAGVMWYGWHTAPSDIRVHVPPDLSHGAVLAADRPEKVNVYSFVMQTYQELNRWETNGEREYGDRIRDLTPRFTPAFRQSLIDDLNTKSREGELANRSRALVSLPGLGFDPARVTPLGDGLWEVQLYFRLLEDVHELNVKDTVIVYPIRVIRYNADARRNPWGLAIDINPGVYPERVRTTELDALRMHDEG